MCAFSLQFMCDIITVFLTCQQYYLNSDGEAAGKDPRH